MADEREEENTAAPDPLAAGRRSLLMQVLGGIALVLLLIGFMVAGIAMLGSVKSSLEAIADSDPGKRDAAFFARIEEVRPMITEQYAPLVAKMDEANALTQGGQMSSLYAAAYDSQAQLALAIVNYRDAIHAIAARIDGSGEWHSYYQGLLQQQMNFARQRALELRTFVAPAVDKPTVPTAPSAPALGDGIPPLTGAAPN